MAGSARAQSEADLAVVTIAGSQASLEHADRLAERLLRHLPAHRLVPPDRVRRELRRSGGAGTLRRAERIAADGRREMQAFRDLDRTASLLNGAMEAYLSVLPLLDSLDAPLRLSIDLATVEIARDRSERVQQALEVAARLDPVLDLDPNELPSRLIQASEAARQSVRDTAILDERSAGRIAGELSVERLVVLQPRPDLRRARVELYDASNGRRVRVWTVDAGELARVGRELAELLDEGEVDVPQEPREPDQGSEGDDEPRPPLHFGADMNERDAGPPDGGGGERPWYRRWWVWTLVSVVVLGGAGAGLYFGVFANDDTATFDMIVEGHW